MRVLLTGGTGFVGLYVAEQLSGLGHSVRALVRSSSDTRALSVLPGVELATGAIESRASLEDAVKGCDAVVHLAGLIKARSEQEFLAVNAGGTQNLLDAAIGAGSLRRFVHVSSIAAVGPSLDGKPLDDTAVPHPVNQYGRSKRAGEVLAIAAAQRLPVTVIRPPLVYGPRDRETLSFFTSIQRGALPIIGAGTNTLSVIYVTDCAAAIVAAVLSDGPSGQAYFVDDGTVHVWREALEDIEAALGKRAWMRGGMPPWAFRLAAAVSQTWGSLTSTAQMLTLDKVIELEQPHWICSSAGARQDLNWAPQVSWKDGVQRAAEWYRKEGLLPSRGPVTS